MSQMTASILAALTGVPVLADEPMAKHTSFRIGGPADLLASPTDEAQLAALLAVAGEHGVPVHVIGWGTNLLIRDRGVRGLVIRLGQDFADVRIKGETITAQAGARLQDLCQVAAEASLSGLEFAIGIPGTLGGGLIMNAGAYGGCLADVVTRVRAVAPTGEWREFAAGDCAFGYRASRFKDSGWILTSASLCLTPGDTQAIRARHQEICAKRRQAQPLNLPSAGSVFQRPPNDYAGRLIEAADLKGARVGGAAVSEKHANFIVNEGGATASDVLELVALVQSRVLETQGVTLEPELIVLGEA